MNDPEVAAGTEPVHGGWYLLAFTTELDGNVTPVSLGSRALMAVRDDADTIRVFDARCPHRGAHLGHGGKLEDGCVVCPFHGRRIRLGAGTGHLRVREHQVLRVGEAVFVRISDQPAYDCGFTDVMTDLADRRPLVAAVTQRVGVPTSLVVENAFDVDHFGTVHDVPRTVGMRVAVGDAGELVIEGEFETRTPPWQQPAGGTFRSRFLARAFSPSVVVTELGPAGASHTVVTGATPTGGGAVARVALGVDGGVAAVLEALTTGATQALRQDAEVWDHLDLTAPSQLDARDRHVFAFRQFCAGFEGSVSA